MLRDGGRWTALLSENQCGMETNISKTYILNKHVEREPMWDGNDPQNEFRFIIIVLSENQCGMETRVRLWDPCRARPVEREPMWDDRSGGEW